MVKKLVILLCCSVFVSTAFADWDDDQPYKWVQYPDLSTNGIDINGTAVKLADDFECTVTGPLTDFHIWCSWLDDAYPANGPTNVDFLIEIYDDLPASQNPDGYSEPNNLLWSHTFAAGDYVARSQYEQIEEGWWDPGTDNYIFPADWTCWQYNFIVPQGEEFRQEGTTDNPVIYWVAIKASPLEVGPLWGWKTSVDHWNDDAVYDADGSGDWKELIYPFGHEFAGESIDLAFVITGEEDTNGLDFGDAPEGANAIAYPSSGVTGAFPTCMTVGPATWIQHTNFGAYFGQTVDFEADGNAGACPTASCFPPYDQDECFVDGDAGLIMPDSFTIDSALNVVTCTGVTQGTSLGQFCTTAVWGTDIDIDVTNTMPGTPPTVGYVNVLIDWDQNGSWGGSATGACTAPEYVLVDFPIPNPTNNVALSSLMAAGTGFTIGPNPGYVWARFSITERPINNPNWDGSGNFEDGETEDYLLHVSSTPPPDTFEFEFSLDIGSDTELSDPALDGDEVFDPGDVYRWQGPLLSAPTDGFKDDAFIFPYGAGGAPFDPWPDPDQAPLPNGWQNTRVPVGDPAYGPINYHEWFDLDGHDQLENSLIQLLGDNVPTSPIPIYADHCIHEPNHLAISYDDDTAPGWPAFNPMSVPVTSSSPAGLVYGTSAADDEIIGVTINQGILPATIKNMYMVADEITVHQNMAPNPDATEDDDDDVDSLDVVPDEQSCPILVFSPDHEATFTDAAPNPLDPGDIYERTAGGPVMVVDDVTHLGITDDPTTEDIIEDADIDALEFVWLPADVQGGLALALLFSVDEDDPLTPGIDESGGLIPRYIYASMLTGWSQPYLEDLDDDIDALTNRYSGPYECFSSTAGQAYTDWVAFGKPDCWCFERNCRGDADGKSVGTKLKGYAYIETDDLNVLLSGWNIKEPPKGLGIATVTGPNGEPGICADFARDQVGTKLKGYARVETNDLNILLTNWNIKEPPKGAGVPLCPLTTAGGDIDFYVYP